MIRLSNKLFSLHPLMGELSMLYQLWDIQAEAASQLKKFNIFHRSELLKNANKQISKNIYLSLLCSWRDHGT